MHLPSFWIPPVDERVTRTNRDGSGDFAHAGYIMTNDAYYQGAEKKGWYDLSPDWNSVDFWVAFCAMLSELGSPDVSVRLGT